MAIINSTDTDYQEQLEGIRILVNNAYEAADMPNSVIENPVNLGDANDKIGLLVPGYEDLSPVYKRRIKKVVKLETAVQLLLSESRLSSEDVEEQESSYESNKIKDTIDEYRMEMSDILSGVGPEVGKFVGYIEASNPPQRF